MTSIDIEFECCGEIYSFPTALRDDQTMLANAALVDTILMNAESIHEVAHPECPKE